MTWPSSCWVEAPEPYVLPSTADPLSNNANWLGSALLTEKSTRYVPDATTMKFESPVGSPDPLAT